MCRRKKHVMTGVVKGVPNLFCGKFDVGGNYNLTCNNYMRRIFMADNFIEQLVENVGKIPTAKVNRTEYLRSCFGINYSDKMEDILKYGPVEGGVPVKEVKAIARKAIYNESAITIGTSFLTGLPGGAAMIATIPTDITQYYLHLIRIAQKLLFLYGWEKMCIIKLVIWIRKEKLCYIYR